jgi:Zn-dependent protease with chaperone function
VVESSAANAFSAGLDPHHASLVVTRGLLQLLERHELEGIIAHELSHIGNYDTRLSTTMAVTVRVLRLPFVIVMGFFRFLFGLHWMLGVGALFYGFLILGSMSLAVPLIASDPESGPMRWILPLALALPVYVLFGAPLLGLLIQRAVSKQWEFLADADAVLLTRHAEGLATALAKMATAGGSRMKVSGATAHLYIVDPLGEDAVWWDRIFSTHPLVEERIAALAGMGGGISPSVLREASEAGAKVAEKDERALGGFRLTRQGTALYAKPDATSAALGELEGGALITVLRREGDFLRVLAAAGAGNVISGYIRRSAAMTEVGLDGPAAA